MNKNILVTGGAGFIGSHMCKALAERGYVRTEVFSDPALITSYLFAKERGA